MWNWDYNNIKYDQNVKDPIRCLGNTRFKSMTLGDNVANIEEDWIISFK